MSEPRQFRERRVTIEAMQYDGVNVQRVLEFCGPAARFDRPSLYIKTPDGFCQIISSEWVVLDRTGNFAIVPDAPFRFRYEEFRA